MIEEYFRNINISSSLDIDIIKLNNWTIMVNIGLDKFTVMINAQ